MRKYVNKLEDFEGYAMNQSTKQYIAISDLLSFALPELEAEDNEVSGSGILGKINLPDWNNMAAPTAELNFASYPDELKHALTITGVKIRMNWGESHITDEAQMEYDSYAAYITGWPKNIPGGDRKKGEKSENTLTVNVKQYELIKNGTKIIEYDPLNYILKIYGTDYASQLKAAIQKY